MAGFLPKQVADFKKIPNTKVAIVSSSWHPQCVQGMADRCIAELKAVGVDEADIEQHILPGALELPYAARQLFEKRPQLDAVIAFGVVLKGATTHDDSVLQTVVDGFASVGDRFNKPIINEVIGVTCIEDAELRSNETINNKGVEAVYALSEIISWQRSL
ncbi:MAG: 6,7-dimethyl-8-ribityllumazine synthase [Pseudomonadales bacterium]